MADFLKQHFDKLLLSSLFLFALGIFMHFARAVEFYSTPTTAAHLAGVVNWLENTVGQILAALLTLMVGRSLSATATSTPAGGASATAGPEDGTKVVAGTLQTSAIPPAPAAQP